MKLPKFNFLNTHNLLYSILCFVFTLGINIHARAAEGDIAKIPTFAQAAGISYLAPPIYVLGINNASPYTLRNIPQQFQNSLDGWGGGNYQFVASSGYDFVPSSTYAPPLRVGTSQNPIAYFPNVSITSAPVDGYAAYYANNLPTGSSPYNVPDYFDGGSFYKNLLGAYKHPLNQISAGQYAFGTSSSIDFNKPYFWKADCVPGSTPPGAACLNPPTLLHTIENDTTVNIYVFTSPTPPGCGPAQPAPIVISCMTLVNTVSDYTNLHQKFANWYSYYSRSVFGQKQEFHKILNTIPENATIYCNQFNRSFQEISTLGYSGINSTIENPCKTDGFYNAIVYAGNSPLSWAANYAPPLTTAEQRARLLFYLNLSPMGFETNASMNTVSFLQRVTERMSMPVTQPPNAGDIYLGRKSNNDSLDLEVNYCRKIYMYLTDPLQDNSTGIFASVASSGVTYGTIPINPLNIVMQNAQRYIPPYQGPYGTFGLYTANAANHYNVIDQVFNLYHLDYKTGNGAPNILPNNFPTGSSYWDTSKDPANWQNIRTWSLSTYPNNYTYFNNTNNNYDFPALYTVLNNAGRTPITFAPGSTVALNSVETVIGQLNAPLTAPTATAAGSAAGVGLSGQILLENGVQYTGFYNADDWSGRVEARRIGSSGGAGNLVWTTAPTNANSSGTIASYLNRNIKTIQRSGTNGTTASVVNFQWSNLNTTQQTALLTSDIVDLVPPANASNAGNFLVNYLRGDKTNEINAANSTGFFRKRSGNMGDVLSSTPVLIQSKNMGFASIAGTEGKKYSDFVNAEKAKTQLVAVGANDGMLHLFNASDANGNGTGDGTEVFAFMPSAIIGKLGKLAKPTYTHEYYVDGALLHQHAFINGAWASLLVGSLGAGGKSVFAIDVTNRANPQVLFELTSEQVPQLGFQFGVPRIARFDNGASNVGTWKMVHGNGFESSSETAALIATTIPPTFTASPAVQVISVAGGPNNGLAPPAIWSDNHKTELIYAGDKKGKLWRFNVAGNAISLVPTPLLNAVSPSTGSPAQPFTSKPDIALHPQGGLMVIAGTGSIYRADDPSKKDTQSLYAIWDHPNFTGTAARANLVQQRITVDGINRVTTNNAFSYAGNTKRGWYMDLKADGANADTGERIVASPSVQFGRVAFNTYLPTTSSISSGCAPLDEKSWFMSLDAFDGSAPKKPIFDTNNDKKITSADLIDGQITSGQKIAATTGAAAVALTYNDQTPATSSAAAGTSQSYAAPAGTCAASHVTVKQGNQDMCIPKDACPKGFMWVKSGQNSADSVTSICVSVNQQKPRLSWKQIQ